MDDWEVPWFQALAVAGTLFFAGSASAATHWVNRAGASFNPPGTSCADPGYQTIQAAVSAAGAGDTVWVCPAWYIENVVVGAAGVSVIATDGPSNTVVQSRIHDDVFRIAYVSGVTIDGFTIIPAGQLAKHDIGVNVYVAGPADASIVHNVFRGGRIGVNLGCGSSGSEVADNVVAAQYEAGINIDTCEGSTSGSTDNEVHHNNSCGGAFAYSIAAGGESDNNEIHNNVAKWISVAGTGNAVHHNTATYFAISAGNSELHNTTDPAVCP
jgi:hypothetical protein